MKMRDLERKTGVNRETIRVYLREGLVPQPQRPARNSADYDERHVRAIRAVRRLQSDNGMTLPQIKAVLEGKQSNRPIGAQSLTQLEELVSVRVGVNKNQISLDELERTYPNAKRDAAGLEKVGIIEISHGKHGEAVTLSDAGLIDIWSRMRAAGFTEENGFPPEILSYYVDAAELVAGREAGIFLEQVKGVLTEDEAASMLEVALPSMLAFFGIIRQRIFLRNIRAETTRRSPTHSVRPTKA
ncbi:MAG: MerR family transcriptional regulator [Sphingomonadaceae bacterium]|nr:MerR family transcriptional regulator [Sphingomonadaceae bacterium]